VLLEVTKKANMTQSAVPRHALLLLPGLSFPHDKYSLQAAYKPTFDQLLPLLSKQISGLKTLRLDIAIVLPQSYSTTDPLFRTHIYPTFQPLLADLYTLVVQASAIHKVDLDIPGGLDVRIILLESPTTPAPFQTLKPLSGPLVNFPTLVPSFDQSTQLYSIDSEAGISLINHFTHHYQNHFHSSPSFTRLPSGPSFSYLSPADVANPAPLVPTCNSHVATVVGGTFDHLHIGHKLLLTFTLFLASPVPQSKPRKVIVGITTDKLLENKKHATVLEDWDIRQKRTAEFVESILFFGKEAELAKVKKEEFIDEPGPNGKVVRHIYTPLKKSEKPYGSGPEGDAESQIVINYTSISDPFGPTITQEDLTALVISAETRKGGAAVNEKRREKGWADCEVFEVDVLGGDGENEVKEEGGFTEKISSTEIRRRMVEIEKKIKDGKL
jgi:phosphopantetheine adenylyltransferase